MFMIRPLTAYPAAFSPASPEATQLLFNFLQCVQQSMNAPSIGEALANGQSIVSSVAKERGSNYKAGKVA